VTDLFGKKVSEDRIMNYIQQVREDIRIVLPSLLWAVGVGLLYWVAFFFLREFPGAPPVCRHWELERSGKCPQLSFCGALVARWE
jgi:hypothetical protein